MQEDREDSNPDKFAELLLLLALPSKIFLKAYNVINDFSDIVFFKKIFIPHMEFFFPLELPPPDTLEFVQTGHECQWVLGVQ